jgi:hypothetical protein
MSYSSTDLPIVADEQFPFSPATSVEKNEHQVVRESIDAVERAPNLGKS